MSRRSSALVLTGLLLLALNLRPAATSVGPVLDEVRRGLGLSAVSAGLLTSLPVVAFAVFGALAPYAARAVGLHRVTLLALLGVVAGLAARAAASGEAVFLAASLLALAGMAIANVLLPSLVKLHFPDRIGTVTALYTTFLAIGLTAANTLTVPVAEATGSWRGGLAVWAALALLAAVPWLPLVARDRALDPAPRSIGFLEVGRTRLGLAMALLFGVQSLQAYAIFGWFPTLWRDSGFTAAQAGALVGLVSATSVPLSFWAPAAVARRRDPRRVFTAIALCYPVGYLGLLVAPHDLAVLWAVLVGIGTSVFPVVLVLIGLRSRTPEGTAALSGFTQSTGYLLAAAGPLGVGVLHDATGSWSAPLLALTALTVPLLLLGWAVCRPAYLEDQLAGARAIPAPQPPRA